MLTTLQRAKDVLQIETDDTDVPLLFLLESASARVEGETGRTFKAANYSEVFTAGGETCLCLQQFPLTTAAPTITVDGVAATGFTVNSNAGILTKADGWKGTVTVSYSAGYVLPADTTTQKPQTLPVDLEMVVIQLAGIALNRTSSEHVSEETIGPLRMKYLDDMPLYLRRTLDRYRRPVL